MIFFPPSLKKSDDIQHIFHDGKEESIEPEKCKPVYVRQIGVK